MASVNDFKIFLAAKLGELLRERVLPGEISLGEVTSVDGGPKSVIDVTYKGEVYPLTYSKFNIERLLSGHGILPIATDVTTIRDMVPVFLKKYALPLTPDDFVDGPVTLQNTLMVVPGSIAWYGQLTVPIADPNATVRPLYDFPLDTDGRNLGTLDVDITAPFTYVEFLGKKWASVGNPVLLGPGVEFDIRKDFTIDFEIIANQMGDVYGQLFTQDGSSATTVGNMWTGRSGLGATMENRPFILSVGYSANAEVITKQLLTDTPMRITITRKGNNWTWYQNSVRVWEFTASPTIANPWRYFGSIPTRSKQYLRELKFWNQRLTDVDRLKLFEKPYELPTPLHEFLFDGTTENTGSDGRFMTVPMTFGNVGGREVAYLPTGGAIAFGNGLSMRICGDYTYDFVVIFAATPATYLCLMSLGTGTNTATGSFFFYQGRQYEYNVHPGGAAILANPAPVLGKPYRITLRSLGGVTTKYVDGVKQIEYPSPALALNRHLTAFRDAGYSWPSNAGIDYIKMWDVGLTDEQLAILFTM